MKLRGEEPLFFCFFHYPEFHNILRILILCLFLQFATPNSPFLLHYSFYPTQYDLLPHFALVHSGSLLILIRFQIYYLYFLSFAFFFDVEVLTLVWTDNYLLIEEHSYIIYRLSRCQVGFYALCPQSITREQSEQSLTLTWRYVFTRSSMDPERR